MLFADRLDVIEEELQLYEQELLDMLLFDRTTRKNIIWATNHYVHLGSDYEFHQEILPYKITGEYAQLIQPRTAKPVEKQDVRTRDNGEVFTPSWVCNKQNNLVDAQWFGRPDVFNKETNKSWIETSDRISFPKKGAHSWKHYVDAKRLEVSCGEAPYLVSRYDAVTGEAIPVSKRIGLLDRKLRVVSEQTTEETEWYKWAVRAVQSVYGFEYQGDNLLLARENLLLTFIDYHQEKFGSFPAKEQLLQIARYISWNIWQMDGLKFVVPDSCKPIQHEDITFFGINIREEPCPGCATGDVHRHTGIYCKIYDWRENSSLTYVSLIGGGKR